MNVGLQRYTPRAALCRGALVGLMALGATASQAVDGCLVLLCFAAPSWRAIPQCVPPITQVLRDLAWGRPFPTCAMAGAGNSASHAWANAPTFCPPQYTHLLSQESGDHYSCEYTGAVSVQINGAAFARTWWSMRGDAVTEFSAEAKAQFSNFDSRFDDDYDAWLAAQPPEQPPVDGGL